MLKKKKLRKKKLDKNLVRKHSKKLDKKILVVLNKKNINGITYQLRGVNCGRCSKIHYAYWYAFWREEGRVFCKYIGKLFKRLDKKKLYKETKKLDKNLIKKKSKKLVKKVSKKNK